MRKTIITIVALFVVVLVAIGIFYEKDDKKGENLKSITVAEVAHSIFYAPMYAADSLGYFNDEGLAHVIVDEVQENLEEEVKDAIESCPVGAISEIE